MGADEDTRRWLNMHEGLKVVGDKLIIMSRCRNLSEDNKCKIYDLRPGICKDFSVGGEDCLFSRKLLEVKRLQ